MVEENNLIRYDDYCLGATILTEFTIPKSLEYLGIAVLEGVETIERIIVEHPDY